MVENTKELAEKCYFWGWRFVLSIADSNGAKRGKLVDNVTALCRDGCSLLTTLVCRVADSGPWVGMGVLSI